MTQLYDLLGSFWLRLLLLGTMLLVLGQVLVLVLAARQRRGLSHLITAALHLAIGLFVMVLLFDGCFRALRLGQNLLEFPLLEAALYSLPWRDLALLGALSGLLLGLSLWGGIPLWRRLGPSAIKETVDLLPTALCVSDAGGTILLSNVRMSQLCYWLTGELLTDAERLWQAVLERGEPQADRYLVQAEAGRALLFARETLAAGAGEWVQITAADVTEQFRITRDLEAKNQRLRDAQYRMKSVYARERSLLISREIMNARAAVHNQMGNVLLTGKYYLDHPDSVGEAELLDMLEYNSYFLLGETERPQPLGEPLEEALHMARSVGVTVELRGPVPAKEPQRSLLAQAVDQCAANTLRHAGGDRLKVELERGEGFLLVRLTNNGAPPGGPVVETGGLATLRRAVEEAGGGMELSWHPVFELRLRLPETGE